MSCLADILDGYDAETQIWVFDPDHNSYYYGLLGDFYDEYDCYDLLGYIVVDWYVTRNDALWIMITPER